jgi:hypothetical protein
MALVPIRCPSCGASVDLEEDQTIVRCGYCRTTSYLPGPAVGSAPLPPVPPGGFPPHPATPGPVPAAKRSTSTLVVLLVVGLIVAGAAGLPVMRGGVGANYFVDARPAAGILRDHVGRDGYLSILFRRNYIYAKVLGDDGR